MIKWLKEFFSFRYRLGKGQKVRPLPKSSRRITVTDTDKEKIKDKLRKMLKGE